MRSSLHRTPGKPWETLFAGEHVGGEDLRRHTVAAAFAIESSTE
jgi:hypothetical protein